MSRIIYARQYNIGLLGLERLHPFDSRKFGRAWRCLRKHFGKHLQEMAVRPPGPVRQEQLLRVHEAAYLERLRDPACVSAALELPQAGRLPGRLLDHAVLRPMRWAAMGSIVAAHEAMNHGLAVNLGGGYHHAGRERGEGFCIYSDIALAIDALRQENRLKPAHRIAYVDLDAHQGNGVCHLFAEDSRLFIFDMYNRDIYPCMDITARERIDCDVPLSTGCRDKEYLQNLTTRLPVFLDSISKTETVAFAIYNAGTDIYVGDPLGALGVSAAGVLERDLFVIRELRQRQIPTLMLLSGGYTRISYKLVADSVIAMLECA